ncbi:efflux RND transporter permease subunit [Lujinxingia litoralis]|nr:MMPL family transporter [Lujinxingia litoralis]
MSSRAVKLAERYMRGVVGRWPGWLVLMSLVLTLVSLTLIATRWNINSDFRALLPSSSEAAQAMEEVGQRVGSGSSLFVVIDSPDKEANLAFAEVYAERLRELPQIALAHYHNDKAFFEQHRLLYMEVEDLEELHRQIKRRIREEKRAQNPLFVPLGKPRERDDKLIDTSEIEARYEDLAHQSYKEYLMADDGYSLTIVVRFVETSTDLAATNQLLDQVRGLGQELDPGSYHPDMKLEYGGGLVSRQAEYTSIVGDIQTSALFTMLGLFLVIALYFRRIRAVFLVLGPLVMGVLWTLAFAFVVHGELTTVTVFIFAILLGLGIDFSIHLLNGYDRARAQGLAPVDALWACYNSVGRATVMGATTTFATFVVLSFAQFRGLSQFGQVAAVGVLMTVLAMVVTMPALILTLQRWWPHEPGEVKGERLIEKAVRQGKILRYSPWALGLAGVVTVWAVTQIPEVRFEENFRRVGQVIKPWERGEATPQEVADREARAKGRQQARRVAQRALEVREEIAPQTYVADREQLSTGAKYTSALKGQQSSTPTLLLLDDAEDTRRLYAHMEAQQAEGELDTVSSVASIYAFMPGSAREQAERLEVIEAMRATLDEDLSFLSASQRERIDEMRESLEVDAITIHDLPEWTKRLFREAGPQAREPAAGEAFAFEYLIYVNERIDHMVGEQARRFLGEVEEATDLEGIDVRVASQSYIYTAMLDEIKEDGARMLGIALVIVFVILSFFFGSALRSAIALSALGVGAVWMFGFCGWFGIKLDFFNVVILPVVIGIGVDDGVHFYHHYLEEGRGRLPEVIDHVGSAIGMTTVTSIIGFGGLAITNYAGLQSLGYLAIVGIGAAFLATVLVLPPFLWLAERRGWERVLGRARD